MRQCLECETTLLPGQRVCPKCGTRTGGSYKREPASLVDREELQRKYNNLCLASVAKANARAEKWLAAKGLMPHDGEEKPAYLWRLSGFREKLKKTPRPNYTQWAFDIIQADEDGESIPLYSIALARKVVEASKLHGQNATESGKG